MKERRTPPKHRRKLSHKPQIMNCSFDPCAHQRVVPTTIRNGESEPVPWELFDALDEALDT